jgi:hypothetical protein
MARRRGNGTRENGSGITRRRRGVLFRRFERFVLSIGMSIIAAVIERRLLKALKAGGMKAAPRTAAERDEYLGEPPPEAPREASVHSGTEGATA